MPRRIAPFQVVSAFALLACGHPSRPPAPAPPKPPEKVAEEAEPEVASKAPPEEFPMRRSTIDRAMGEQPSRGHWERTTFVCDGKTRAGAASLLGIGAPSPPPQPAVAIHVRRRPTSAARATVLHPELARALDAATYDTSYCATVTDAAKDVVLVLSVKDGRVVSVVAEDGTTPPTCLLDRACELAVPKLPGLEKAAVGLLVRRLSDSPATISVTGRRVEAKDAETSRDVDILKAVFRDAATGCEQGELLGPKPTGVVFEVTATPHSTVPPTLNLTPVSTTTPPPPRALVQCVIDRLEGYRLPMSPWHDVGLQNVHVTWGG